MAKIAKKELTNVGYNVPSNLKFGIIVTLAIFWAGFLKDFLTLIFSPILEQNSPVVADFILAIVATVFGFLILSCYSKIRSRLEKVKV